MKFLKNGVNIPRTSEQENIRDGEAFKPTNPTSFVQS